MKAGMTKNRKRRKPLVQDAVSGGMAGGTLKAEDQEGVPLTDAKTSASSG